MKDLRFDLICIDMFQTLVNIETRAPHIWRRILGEKYTDEIAHKCARLVSQKAINGFHDKASKSKEFQSLRAIFTPCFEEIAAETELGFDYHGAVEVFLTEHGFAGLYEDTLPFFDLMKGKLPVCLVSDADVVMIQPILEKLKFDCVFISEQVSSYKNDPEGRIFKEVLSHYQVDPDRVLHIGDSSSDIIGANRAGIKSCWINRTGHSWKYDVQPDFEIRTLTEILHMID